MKSTIPKIKQITSSDVLPIRHKVMWPNKPIKYVELPNDESARHFGLFINEQITSIISLFIENNEAQFRKFATLVEFQGLGYGTLLLKNSIDLIQKEGIKKLWCNARVDKALFYNKFGMTQTNKRFTKEGVDFVIMEKIFIGTKD